jgi:hypothetical protein
MISRVSVLSMEKGLRSLVPLQQPLFPPARIPTRTKSVDQDSKWTQYSALLMEPAMCSQGKNTGNSTR